MMTVAIAGLFTAFALADSLYPTTKEAIASVVIIIMSAANILIAAYIKELYTNKKNDYGTSKK